MGRYLKLIDKLIRAQQELAEKDKRVRDYWSSGEGNIGLLRVVGTDGESILLKVKDGRIVHASRDEKPIHVFKCSEDTFLDILSKEMTLREAATKGHFSIEDSDTGEINLVELQKFAKAFEELNYLLRKIL